jgi:hypothetical protein
MMNSNNHLAQDYSNVQTGNNFDFSQIPNNNNNNNNLGISNTNNAGFHNDTFVFYLALPNDTRVYYVTYTELQSLETARLLNNGINLSHIPDDQFSHHHKIQTGIQQQVVQRQVHRPQQQSFDTMNIGIQPTSQVYSDDNTYNVDTIFPDGSISVVNMQDTGHDRIPFEQTQNY